MDGRPCCLTRWGTRGVCACDLTLSHLWSPVPAVTTFVCVQYEFWVNPGGGRLLFGFVFKDRLSCSLGWLETRSFWWQLRLPVPPPPTSTGQVPNYQLPAGTCNREHWTRQAASSALILDLASRPLKRINGGKLRFSQPFYHMRLFPPFPLYTCCTCVGVSIRVQTCVYVDTHMCVCM